MGWRRIFAIAPRFVLYGEQSVHIVCLYASMIRSYTASQVEEGALSPVTSRCEGVFFAIVPLDNGV